MNSNEEIGDPAEWTTAATKVDPHYTVRSDNGGKAAHKQAALKKA